MYGNITSEFTKDNVRKWKYTIENAVLILSDTDKATLLSALTKTADEGEVKVKDYG
jgi:hypothetical protein